MREKQIETALVNAVRKIGGIAYKMSPFHFKGIPDRLILLPDGKIFFVEVKSPGKELRKSQFLVKDKLEKLGFKVYKLDAKEQIAEILKVYE